MEHDSSSASGNSSAMALRGGTGRPGRAGTAVESGARPSQGCRGNETELGRGGALGFQEVTWGSEGPGRAGGGEGVPSPSRRSPRPGSWRSEKRVGDTGKPGGSCRARMGRALDSRRNRPSAASGRSVAELKLGVGNPDRGVGVHDPRDFCAHLRTEARPLSRTHPRSEVSPTALASKDTLVTRAGLDKTKPNRTKKKKN
jgi:hypothetical protein